MGKAKVYLVVMAAALCASNAAASIDPFVGLTCDGTRIRIEYERIDTSSAEHSVKEDIARDNNSNYWRLRKLRTVKSVQDELGWKAWVENTETVTRECKISGKDYKVSIGVISGNPGNLYGMCGGWLTGWAKIEHLGETVLDIQFEEECNGATVIPFVEYDGTGSPTIRKISIDEYHQ